MTIMVILIMILKMILTMILVKILMMFLMMILVMVGVGNCTLSMLKDPGPCPGTNEHPRRAMDVIQVKLKLSTSSSILDRSPG